MPELTGNLTALIGATVSAATPVRIDAFAQGLVDTTVWADGHTDLTTDTNGGFIVDLAYTPDDSAAYYALTTLDVPDPILFQHRQSDASTTIEGHVAAYRSRHGDGPPTIEYVKGDPGDRGPRGFGVQTGGTAGQALVKASDADYDTEWETLTAPSGSIDATARQRAADAQAAADAADTAADAAQATADTNAAAIAGLPAPTPPTPANRLIPPGGTTGQVLKKDAPTDYEASWQDDSGGTAGGVEPWAQTGDTTQIPVDKLDNAPLYKGPYSATATYQIGDLVFYASKLWMARNPNISNSEPGDANGNWSLQAAGAGAVVGYRGNWTSQSTYQIGQSASHANAVWVSLTSNNTGNEPQSTSDHWHQWEPGARPAWVNNSDQIPVTKLGTDINLGTTEYLVRSGNSAGTPAEWRRVPTPGPDESEVDAQIEQHNDSATAHQAIRDSIPDVEDWALHGTAIRMPFSKLIALPPRSDFNKAIFPYFNQGEDPEDDSQSFIVGDFAWLFWLADDPSERVQDVVGAMVVAAGGSYDDGAGSITLPAGRSVEELQDTVAAMFDTPSGQVTYDDDAGKLAIVFPSTSANTRVFKWFYPGSDPDKLVLEEEGHVTAGGEWVPRTGAPFYVGDGGNYVLNIADAADFSAVMAGDARLGGGSAATNFNALSGNPFTTDESSTDEGKLLITGPAGHPDIYRIQRVAAHNAVVTFDTEAVSKAALLPSGYIVADPFFVERREQISNTAANFTTHYVTDENNLVYVLDGELYAFHEADLVRAVYDDQTAAAAAVVEKSGNRTADALGLFLIWNTGTEDNPVLTIRRVQGYTPSTSTSYHRVEYVPASVTASLLALANQSASISDDVASLETRVGDLEGASGGAVFACGFNDTTVAALESNLVDGIGSDTRVNVGGFTVSTHDSHDRIVVPVAGTYRIEVQANATGILASGSRSVINLRIRIYSGDAGSGVNQPNRAFTFNRGQYSTVDDVTARYGTTVTLAAGDSIELRGAATYQTNVQPALSIDGDASEISVIKVA